MNEIKVLDHGFIRLVSHHGDDALIVRAARTSYGDGTKSVREDSALLDYLVRHQHTSPLELVKVAPQKAENARPRRQKYAKI